MQPSSTGSKESARMEKMKRPPGERQQKITNEVDNESGDKWLFGPV